MKINPKEQASSVRAAAGIRLQGRLAARAIRSDIRKELGVNAYQAKLNEKAAHKAAKQAEKTAVEAAKRAAAWALLDTERQNAVVSGLVNTGFSPQAPVFPTKPFVDLVNLHAKATAAKTKAAVVSSTGTVKEQAISMLAAMGFTPGEEFDLINFDNVEK